MQESPHKKILYIITKSNWGGAQAYVYTLATHAKSSGADVVVALGGTGTAGAEAGLLASRLQEAGIRTVFISTFTRDIRMLREFSLLSELQRVIRSEKPDIVHLNSSKAGGVGALASRLERVPCIIFTSHGLAYDEDKGLFTRTFRWLSTWATILLTHATILISSDTYARASALPFCKKKVHLIYNGLRPLPLWPRREARKQLVPHAPRGHVWIGTVAELTPNKALDTLVSAAANLKSRGYTFTLVLIGEGEERATLAKLIADAKLEDSVHMLGFVPDAGNLLAAFDIFALVSTKEGLPYVLLEAGQAGCAVVGTRIAGTTDIIDSTTGLLVRPKSIRETADALELLIKDETKRHSYGEALHRRVKEKFSLARMLLEIQKLYDI